MSGLDLTSFAAALKTIYTPSKIENLTYSDNPFLAMLAKDENFLGDGFDVPIIYGNPQGRSATFANAQTRGALTSTGIKKFVLTRTTDYGISVIDNETIEASKGNEGAFLRASQTEIDGTINGLKRSLGISIFRSGFGEIGQIATGGITTDTVTLANADEITNFEVGQSIVFSSSIGGAVLRNSAGSLIVKSVDRSLGKVTFTADVSTLNAVAAADYMFIEGDRENSATPTRKKIAGLAAWLPTSAPASTAFFGVDRTVDSTRLAGLRLSAVGSPIEEAFIDANKLAAREGGHPDKVLCNFATWGKLEKSLGSKVQYIDFPMNASVGFRGIRIQGPTGPIDVIGDRNCPPSLAYMLQLDTWKLYSLGKVPRVLSEDGLDMLRRSASDDVEIRWGYRVQLGCSAPGFNVVISL